LVESSLSGPLDAEIARLEQDLRGNGYQVFFNNVVASEVTSPSWKTNVANAKNLIRANYDSDTNANWTIFILGHVPIPYSGLYSPGSHTENYGAQPADWYYAELHDSNWTDATVNNITADFPWNWNVPGDGKFDQNDPPSQPELRIGRVDLVNMPAFGKSEIELLRQYLNRNHAWRHRQFTSRDRGLVNGSGVPFESYNTYASCFGSITNCDLVPWLSIATNPASSYLMASSYGSGQFTRDNQLGSTEDFAASSLYAVFTSMYGSYYGNWDSAMHSNVVLKAPLASDGYALTSYYRRWVNGIDSMSMDEPIGYETYAMAANKYSKSGARHHQYAQVNANGTFTIDSRIDNYTTLMGDPTLRLRMVAPPTQLSVITDGTDKVISWTAAQDTDIQGYHVYRAPLTNLNGFIRLTSTPVPTRSYRDTNAAMGSYQYMVRTIKLEQTPNRSYYNASQGVMVAGISRLTATFTSDDARTLLISGDSGHQYTVEYATNLSNVTAWYPLTNLTLSGPVGTISLPNTNQVIFYRLQN
jgi:hypothetical protein